MRRENITSMNISLTEMMKEHVHNRVAGGTYTSISDYVRDLIHTDMERPNKLETLRRLIKEGLESGEATPLDVEEIKAEARRRFHR